jgi:hypothetical protein
MSTPDNYPRLRQLEGYHYVETSKNASSTIKTNHPLTNSVFTTALNKLRPKSDCQVQIGNEVVHMITSPGLNPILNTHTDMDETFGTDLSQKLFWIRKGHNFHSLTTQWGKIDKYCWRLQQYLRLD